jgi:hypothetical protein
MFVIHTPLLTLNLSQSLLCDDLVRGDRERWHDHLVYGACLGPVQHGGHEIGGLG